MSTRNGLSSTGSSKLEIALQKYILKIPSGVRYRNASNYWLIEKPMRLKHLLSFCKIKDKERHRLIDMINSSDEENYTVAELIILNKLNNN